MVPKFVITVLIVLGAAAIIGAQYASMKRCQFQWECDLEKECCTKRIFRNESYCVARRKIGEICLNNGLTSTLRNGVYDITCPCQFGLECKQELYTMPNGITYAPYGNAKCRTIGFPGFGNPFTRPNYGLASASAGSGGSYGNGGSYGTRPNFGQASASAGSGSSYGNGGSYDTRPNYNQASASAGSGSSYGNGGSFGNGGNNPYSNAVAY